MEPVGTKILLYEKSAKPFIRMVSTCLAFVMLANSWLLLIEFVTSLASV